MFRATVQTTFPILVRLCGVKHTFRPTTTFLLKLPHTGRQIGPLFLSPLFITPSALSNMQLSAAEEKKSSPGFHPCFSQLHPLVRRHGPDASLPHLRRQRHLQQPLPAEHLLRHKLGKEPHLGVRVRHVSDARSLQEHLCALLFALSGSEYVGLSYILHYSQVSCASA